MDSTQLRKEFINFFVSKGHTHLSSSALVPWEDPSILFTNAGMNQFKDVFLGNEKRDYTKAVTVQKCLRVGGKHNDLSQVGFSPRHLTFFEMLGNFSFGDYGKKEAISYAWEFLTSTLKINSSKLWVTVHHSDNESYNLWKDVINVDPSRIVKLGDEDNFWQMGDTGPCGPCTEIYYDYGVEAGEDTQPGGPSDRFVEIWNLVFMQYNQNEQGEKKTLSKIGIDTGIGLERLAAVLQSVNTLFHTKTFMKLIKEIEKLSSKKYDSKYTNAHWFHVIADHIRSTGFLLSEGMYPGADGRGYVLRKIIRRALLFAYRLGNINIFYKLVPTFVSCMKSAYPELVNQQDFITDQLKEETHKFEKNLEHGQKLFQKCAAHNNILSGKDIFTLYDTYGFPPELTEVLAHERNWKLDIESFNQEMKQQKERSKKASKFESALDLSQVKGKTTFIGYDQLECTSKIIAIINKSGEYIDSLDKGIECTVICDQTCFYPEGGGQVSDIGIIKYNNIEMHVKSVIKAGSVIGLSCTSKTTLTVGTTVSQHVNPQHRFNTTVHHSATHLLHDALQKQFGSSVTQAGSYVGPDLLRFDFTINQALTNKDIEAIEQHITSIIYSAQESKVDWMSYDKALLYGATATFTEKYDPHSVRVVTLGPSKALCGGTHVKNVGQIGAFKIIDTSSVASGVRRITAVAADKAQKLFTQYHDIVCLVKSTLQSSANNLLQDLTKHFEQNKELQKEHKQSLKNIAILHGKLLGHEALKNNKDIITKRIDVSLAQFMKEVALGAQEIHDCTYILTSPVEGKPVAQFYMKTASSKSVADYEKTLNAINFKGKKNNQIAQGIAKEYNSLLK